MSTERGRSRSEPAVEPRAPPDPRGLALSLRGLREALAPRLEPDGAPLGAWLGRVPEGGERPLRRLFRGLADSSSLPSMDKGDRLALFLAGLSLMLGLFTRLGALGAPCCWASSTWPRSPPPASTSPGPRGRTFS